MSGVVRKPWGFCRTPRHNGIDYGDNSEQSTDPDTSAGWPLPSDENT